jgi:hypothetical protein
VEHLPACLCLQQLRVDLLDFSVSEPDANGFCVNDYLEIAGGASSVPRICGENTNEHGEDVHLCILACESSFRSFLILLIGIGVSVEAV